MYIGDVVHRVEAEVYKEWLAQVDEACSFNLSQPLVQRNPDNKLIGVNFDPQVTFGLLVCNALGLL